MSGVKDAQKLSCSYIPNFPNNLILDVTTLQLQTYTDQCVHSWVCVHMCTYMHVHVTHPKGELDPWEALPETRLLTKSCLFCLTP